jgi:hypothetical protein
MANEQRKLSTFFQQRTVMSGYARHVLDFVLLTWQAEDPPSWLPTLSKELVELQAQAASWFAGPAPSLTRLPQTYVDASNAFAGQMPQIAAVINRMIANGGRGSDDDVQALTTLFNCVLISIRARGGVVQDCATTLQGYGDNLGAAIKAMTEGAASIKSAIGDENEAIHQLGNDIDNLKSMIAADINNLIGTVIVGAAGLAGLGVSITLTVMDSVSGWTAGLGIFIAACTAIAGIVSLSLTAANLVADQQAIAQKQAQLSVEGQQLVVLKGLSSTLGTMLHAYQDPHFKLDPLNDSWTTLEDNLESVRDLIIAERTDVAGLKSTLADLHSLQDQLAGMASYATQLQSAALAGDVQPMQLLTIPQAQAA